MKNINPKINTSITKKAKNNDALALKFEKTKGLCVLADGKNMLINLLILEQG